VSAANEPPGSTLLLEVARPMLPAIPRLEPGEREQLESELADFLSAQVGAMPGYLRIPFAATLVAFEWLPVLGRGRRYSKLEGASQARFVAACSRSGFRPFRELLRLVRSCALFFYLDHPLARARLETQRDVPVPGSSSP
jgi:hypothetical protein